jgi:O-antigen/teichoic acid export membrane protein
MSHSSAPNSPAAMIKIDFTNTVLRNTTWLLFGQGLKLVIQALYFVEIARSLGPGNYGAFVGVVALVGIAVPFADLGSGNLLVKNVSQNRSLFTEYWGRALFTIAGSGSVLFVIVLIMSRFVLAPAIPAELVLLVAASDLFVLSLVNICGSAFQAFDRLYWTAGLNVLGSAARFLGASALIALHSHPTPLQWGYIYFGSTSIVAAVAVLLVLSKLGMPKLNWQHSANEAREGVYFATGLSAQTIYNDIDKTMLTRLGTLEATGIYGAAYRIIDVCFVPMSSLLVAAYANFFRAGSKGVGACFAYAKPILLRALAYPILMCVVLLLSAGLVPHILGAKYEETAEALRWLALLPILKLVSYVFSNVLTGGGYQGLRTSVQVGVAVFNVLLNLWIIPVYSWRGAAWSSLTSDALLALGTGVAVLMVIRRDKPALVRVNAMV